MTKLRILVAALLAASVLTGCGSREGLEWERVVPAGDCHCADGSAFGFWERRADQSKVVLFLNGGGVCWDARTCAFTGENGESDFYDWGGGGAEPENRNGMFDVTRSDNPFADYSYLYVSSCTGDAHLGNVSREYGPGLTVEHRGYVNGTAALDHLAAQYPDAEEVVVVGKTAGSVAAPLYGGMVADRLPGARVTVFGAQSGAWPDDPEFNTDVLSGRWGAYEAVPDWAVEGLAAGEWGVPKFWIQAARHAPALTLGRFDFAYDPHAASEVAEWMDAPDLLAQITANEAAIESAGVVMRGYTAPGDDHGLFEFEKFYEIEVDGVALTDWIEELIGGAEPADVG